MKTLIAIILVLTFSAGAWFGAISWRRNQMLDSGRVLLLINVDSGVYTYTDLMPRDEITRDYKIVGYADELSAEAIAQATVGLFLKVDAETVPGDPRITPVLPMTAPVPENDQQQSAWSSAVSILPQPQRDLCGQIGDTLLQQYCLARHIVYNAIKADATADACLPLYVEAQKEECVDDLQGKDPIRFPDTNQNNLIDHFESFAQPYEQRVNQQQLPEIIL